MSRKQQPWPHSARRMLVSVGVSLGVLMTVLTIVAVAAGGNQSQKGSRVIGGQLTYLSSQDVDSFDTGKTCTEFGYSIDMAVNRPLYYFKPGDPNAVPDLASGPAIVSKNQKVVTVHLKHGVRFAPPVNREITSADVAYAIERLYTKQVANCYAFIYYKYIAGAPSGPTNFRRLSGIQTPNKYTIVFHLSKPVAAGFVPALAMPGTSPVPPEVAKPLDQKNPSQYAQHVAYSGPYVVKSYTPGQQIVLVRNPNASRAGQVGPDALDQITISEGNSDLTVASRRALAGSGLACCDVNPPGPVLAQAQQTPAQITSAPGGIVDYVTLDQTIKPLNNINIRKAIAAGMNRQALLLGAGGGFAASVASGFIPPGVPGYTAREASQFDWNRSAQGNMALAKQYMLKAKAQGEPVSSSGIYTGRQNLVIVGVSVDPGSKAALIMQSELQALGFHVTVRQVATNSYFTKFCENGKSTGVAVCVNNTIAKDFPDELGIMPIFIPGSLAPIGTPDVTSAILKAEVTFGKARRAAAWQRANNAVMSHAVSIPYAYGKNVVLTSKNVSVAISPLWSGDSVDFTFSHLK